MSTPKPDKTIDQLFEEFLADQEARLSPKTFDKYDGIIHLYRSYLESYWPDHSGKDYDAVTKAKYENFDLTFDWKISKKGNSGVIFHIIDVGDETYESGPEYQILDNSHGEPPLQQAASLFALVAPSKDMTAPVGQWNHARLVVDHGKVQHWLNGVMVTEYEIGSPDFKARVDHSKFRQWPQFASSSTGHIALQNHGDAVWFRDLKIRPLR